MREKRNIIMVVGEETEGTMRMREHFERSVCFNLCKKTCVCGGMSNKTSTRGTGDELTAIDKWPVMHPVLSEGNIEMYKEGWPSGVTLNPVRVSVGTPAIVTEVFRVCFSSSGQMAGMYLDRATTASC